MAATKTSNLYLVATPIGNLKDITLRALEVLSKVDYILAEDTRKTGFLLANFNLPKKPLISFFEGNEKIRIPEALNLLNQGKKIALVTNAGTPLISDPGFKLVRECIRLGIEVESIPGASALLTGLTSSGLATDKFLFLGFLPKKQGKRKKILENVSKIGRLLNLTVILFISPYKLIREIKEIKEIWGDIEVVIARELTKIHEEIRREKLTETLKRFSKTKPKGELVLLFRI